MSQTCVFQSAQAEVKRLHPKGKTNASPLADKRDRNAGIIPYRAAVDNMVSRQSGDANFVKIKRKGPGIRSGSRGVVQVTYWGSLYTSVL